MDELKVLGASIPKPEIEMEARLSALRQAIRLLKWVLVTTLYLALIGTLNVFAHAFGWWPA